MRKNSWKEPDCLSADICDARDLDEAVWLAIIQLDLIEEGQDGTEHYTSKNVKEIKAWIKANSKRNKKS